jgi:hypothetical protein
VRGLRWLLVVAAAAAVPWTQRRVDAAREKMPGHESGLYLWTGRHVKRLFPGFESLAADIYWVRTVQYFGGTRAFSTDRDFALLEPLTDITVTLDPRMEIAYRYGAVFLAEAKPTGAGRPQSAVALLERGVKANPLNWRLRKELGYFHYVFLHDPQTASRVLLEAAELPGAAVWLRTMAADILGRGGNRETARVMWRQMYEEEEPGPLKRNAQIHLAMLDAMDVRDRLQGAVDEFTRRAGRRPRVLTELLAAGVVDRLPLDPTGVPYHYDPQTGQVALARGSPLWRPDR